MEQKELREYAEELEEKYETLLEELPQYTYSKAGTPPLWVSEEVEENTYIKAYTQDDVKMIIENSVDFKDLKQELTNYFELKEVEE